MRLIGLKLCNMLKKAGILHLGFAAMSKIDKMIKPSKCAEDPFGKLEAIFPDSGGSCIADNIVDEKPVYDVQVIMPVYNTEHTLRQAIESVLRQRGGQRILLTIVNDGSPDNSAEILDEYRGHEGIEIITQENKGLSGARNAALSHLKARYVTFLDSDDWLSEDAISALYSAAEEGGFEIVQGSFSYVYEDGTQKSHILPEHKADGRMPGFAWGKLIRSELFRHIRFPEGYWYEDTIMSGIIEPVTEARSRASIPAPVYFYRENPKGITRTASRRAKIVDTIYVTRRVYEDRNILGLPLRDDEYDQFLRQAFINIRRVNSYGDRELTHLAFFAMKELKDRNFPRSRPSSPELKLIHYALAGADAGRFLLATDLM